MSVETVEALIVGAGQAGLAVSALFDPGMGKHDTDDQRNWPVATADGREDRAFRQVFERVVGARGLEPRTR